ncbi:MAG: hypothetical protein QME12_04655 [Nanoarchaeota archaeon]|nr:hypothetical protein [Nanoarchaeota archaeon]
MKKIYFPPRRKNRAGQIIAFLLVFLLVGGVITLLNKDKAIDLTGRAIYSREISFDEAAPFCESCSNEASVQMQGQISEENTKEGLVVKYGALKQEHIEIGIPVKWVQELQVSNPRAWPVRLAKIELDVPADAFNVNVFMYGAKLSEGRVLEIPYFAAHGNLKIDIKFETSPVFIEIIEDKASFPKELSVGAVINVLQWTKTWVKVWHNSSMHYYNVPVEIDIKLGEEIVELSGNGEKDIQFDYARGKARWMIEEL